MFINDNSLPATADNSGTNGEFINLMASSVPQTSNKNYLQ